MADFKPFSKLVHDRFTLLSKNELFVTVDGNAVWEKYLASFPDGTNPIYKERTENEARRAKLIEALENKQNSELNNMSSEDILKELEKLS